jgi:hypothetical protein
MCTRTWGWPDCSDTGLRIGCVPDTNLFVKTAGSDSRAIQMDEFLLDVWPSLAAESVTRDDGEISHSHVMLTSSESAMVYRIEYASSSRAKCKGQFSLLHSPLPRARHVLLITYFYHPTPQDPSPVPVCLYIFAAHHSLTDCCQVHR